MNLKRKAEALPKSLRKQIIMEFRETDLHRFLKELFQVMEPDYTVEITHGTQEFGKDLVIVKNKGLITHVIGVVVKCGNINGKTLGDVDALKSHAKDVLSKGTTKKIEEIRSQIEQAETHPAETKSILEDLPVSTVYVVLAGEFSKNARKRLTNELKTAIAEVEANINAILDKLTNLPKPEQVRLLLLMTLIEEDKRIYRLIRRQLGKLKKSAPAAFKSLLPAKRKGFR